MPVYRKSRSGVLLIGTLHDDEDQFPMPERKVVEFKARLGKLDHLAFEGDRALHSSLLSREEHWKETYEGIAFAIFKGKRHFLDKRAETDHAALLLQYGVSAETFGVTVGLSCVGDLIGAFIGRGAGLGAIESSGMVRYYIEMPIETMQRQRIQGLGRVDKREIAERAMKALSSIVSEFDQRTAIMIGRACGAFDAFLGAIRDERVYGPRLIEIARLEGRKGVLIGAGHLENLERILGGGNIEIDWKAYVDSMDEGTRKAVRMMEDAASR